MFLESPTFPDSVSFHMSGGPVYDTTIVKSGAGFEWRDQTAEYPLHEYQVSFDVRLAEKFSPLQPFFRVARGRLNSFRVRDWADYQHNDAGGTGLLVMIDATHYQLIKRYTAGAQSEDRFIVKPRTVVITGAGTYTLDTTTGIVTITSGAAPTVWQGVFDVPCRFDTDKSEWQIIDRSGNQFAMGWQSITLTEVRL